MDLKEIKNGLAKLSALVGGWSDEDVPAIERDMALEELRRIYDTLRFDGGVAAEAQPEDADEDAVIAVDLGEVLSLGAFVDMPVGEEPEPEVEVAEEPEVEPEPEPEVEPEPEEPEIESEPELETEPEDSEPEVESEPELEEPFAEPDPFVDPDPFGESEPKPQPAATQTLFGFEDTVEIHRRKQRVIMSLYDDAPQPKAAAPAADEPFFEEITVDVVPEPEAGDVAEPVVAAEPQAEVVSAPVPEPEEVSGEQESEIEILELDSPEAPSGAVLGEVINSDVQTLADTIAPVEDVASQLRREPIADLRKSIGVNDKYLLIRDLFGGNGASYEIAIRALNNFESLDDCMIYIAEHYAWNPNSDGAKLMMELLERKYC